MIQNKFLELHKNLISCPITHVLTFHQINWNLFTIFSDKPTNKQMETNFLTLQLQRENKKFNGTKVKQYADDTLVFPC